MATAAELQVRDRIFIGGEWVEPEGARDDRGDQLDHRGGRWGRSRPARPPTPTAPCAPPARPSTSWSQTSREERAGYLGAIAAGLGERSEEIAATIAQELGMPLKLSQIIQAGLPTGQFAAMPGLMEEVAWEEEIGNSRVLREPVGVLGAITPWNYPLNQIAAKVAPALAAGCTVVLKPSEVVPLNAFILAEVIEAAGLPAGVFNLVTGTGPVVGEAIAGHPGVDMVSFTGSTRAGRRVSELASATVKPVAMELGGKSPNVILDDADLERGVPDGVAKCFLNSGQTCSALTRMLVPREKLAEAEEIAAAGGRGVHPRRPVRRVDPARPARLRRSSASASAATSRRARPRGRSCSPAAPSRPEGLDRGYFVRPTVFSEVTPEMTIAQEEIFGPVLAIQPYEDEEDAVRIANDTDYGLAGGVWSADQERAIAVATPHPHRPDRDQRRRLQPARPVRRLQAVGPRPRERPLRDRGAAAGQEPAAVGAVAMPRRRAAGRRQRASAARRADDPRQRTQ